MNYKEIIYQNYVSNHNSYLYGQESLINIQKNFPIWRYYFSKLLPKRKESKILDIGCGTGAFLYFLNSMGYNNTSGIDLSAEQINLGHKLGIKNLEVADIKEFLNLNENKFDLIIARDVLEHFTKNEVFEILLLVANALADNGRFLIQVPNGQGLFHTTIYYGDYTHETAYTESSLQQVFKNTGFKNVQCRPTGPVPYGIVSFFRYIIWEIIVLFLKLLKGIESGNTTGIFTQNIIALAIKNK